MTTRTTDRTEHTVLSTQCAVCFALFAWLLSLLAAGVAAADTVTLARGGKAALPIVFGQHEAPAAEVKMYLERITGAEFALKQSPHDGPAIFVGTIDEFPAAKVADAAQLDPQGCVLLTTVDSVYLLGREALGVQHAATTFLERLGCRWFFPGQTWEVVPKQRDLEIALDERSSPSFPTQRRIWYGFGAFKPCEDDWQNWNRHNRMGGPRDVSIGHSWAGLNPEKDFPAHPEWFALVDGQRQAAKPCYAHPEVLARAKQAALAAAERGEKMISLTPPDGLGYCTCEKCLAAADVKEFYEDKGAFFGKNSRGELVNVTSETVFRLANEVAAAVAEKHPDVLVGCYAYSAYSHPPSFKLHPTVYLQTTTAFRRTPLSLDEQLKAFGDKTQQLGIREYYSVYQWDWDYPDPGKLTPDQLQTDLRFFHNAGVTAINAEASNNWAARGLGYYIAAQLMWNVNADVRELVMDFYQQAFGPAAPAMERYYVRWYGPSVAVLRDAKTDVPAKQIYFENNKHNLDALRGAYSDLDEALRLAGDDAAILARIDHLRMYQHYLLLRWQLERAAATGDVEKIRAAIGEETTFGAQLTYTNMLHTRPLIGKAFERRFRPFVDLLKDHSDAMPNGPWRTIGTPPTRAELEQLWARDLKLVQG